MRIALFLVLLCRAKTTEEDRRSFKISLSNDWRFQCTNTTCPPFMTMNLSNIRLCQTTCLAQIQCQAATFYRSISSCQIFTNILNQQNNMVADAKAVTMFVISGTRIPPEPTTTSTSSTTSSSSTSTSSTTSSSSSSSSTTSTSSTTSSSSSSSSSSTTSTSTTTSSSSTSRTTSTTVSNYFFVTGTQNYATEIIANGYHGIQKIRYYSITNTGSSLNIGYPIVYLSGTTFGGSYVNNAWYGLHAGCGNANGIATCTGICKALSKTYISITTTCGSGYPGSVTSYVNPDRAVYTSTDSTSTSWTDYGAASTCGNPMMYCECTT
ncbi:hypothetical protein I4U23_023320 [Adineta vaga]|nr:hypothetical protein I4U23_023320 [Adineta vaga]